MQILKIFEKHLFSIYYHLICADILAFIENQQIFRLLYIGKTDFLTLPRPGLFWRTLDCT